MNDILPPPKRPLGGSAGVPPRPVATAPPRQMQRPAAPMQQSKPALPPVEVPLAPQASPVTSTSVAQPGSLSASSPRPRRKKRVITVLIGIIILLVLAIVGALLWYQQNLQPRTSQSQPVAITVASGMSPSDIGKLLEEKAIIRNSLAFMVYLRLNPQALQAGSYQLSPAASTPDIVGVLAAGKIDQLSITFLPGATVAENKKVLSDAGYSQEAIQAAFGKTYDHPLFATKPPQADLEGYIYGETYHVARDTSVEAILKTTFDHYYDVIQKDDLVSQFKAQNLDLYEAITLASIIQREVPTAADQKQVAQVFLKRLRQDMMLGSDVTYQYAAKKLGVAPNPDLESPYNTRKYTGLPPGPIASPGRSALQAVAQPASGDYLYFLSGDDDKTYFATTFEQHEANIRDYCHKKCAVF